MISGFFDPESRWPIPMVQAYITVPDVTPRWTLIDFLVDTGASDTSLHPQDARQRLRIDAELLDSPSRWPSVIHAGGIGGGASYYPVPASYAFFHDDGTLLVIDGKVDIARPTHVNRRIPSLLGWDVLERFEIVVNRRAGRVTLEPL